MTDVLLLEMGDRVHLIPRTEDGFGAVCELPSSYELQELERHTQEYPRFEALQLDRTGIEAMLSELEVDWQAVSPVEAGRLEPKFTPSALSRSLQDGHVASCCAEARTRLNLVVPLEKMRDILLSDSGWMSLAGRLVRYYEPKAGSLDSAERDMLYDLLARELTHFEAWPSYGESQECQQTFQRCYAAEAQRRGWVAR